MLVDPCTQSAGNITFHKTVNILTKKLYRDKTKWLYICHKVLAWFLMSTERKCSDYTESIATFNTRREGSLSRRGQFFNSESVLHIYTFTVLACIKYCCHMSLVLLLYIVGFLPNFQEGYGSWHGISTFSTTWRFFSVYSTTILKVINLISFLCALTP